MKNKLVVITGGTSGIGLVAAKALASIGARLILIARDQGRGEAAVAALAPPHEGRHRIVLGDLSTLGEMRRVAAEIAAAEPRIDVLINNAGAMFDKREVTADGLERTFAVNHMAYFVVTQGLLPSLAAAPSARIVSTASTAHSHARLDFSDLQVANSRVAFANAYGKSKLCNVLWTRELARRLAGTGITANTLHPGFVASRFGDNMNGPAGKIFRTLKVFGASPEKGADTSIYLASSAEVEGQTGGYWVKRRRVEPSAFARDGEAGARLWAESERLAGDV